MIGQNKFKSFLESWKNPPQFIILQGEIGSGRSTLIDLIKSRYKFNSITCGTSVDEIREVIQAAYQIKQPSFYIFYNGDKLSISAKNALLKIVEEPPVDSYFIMRTENSVIDTLRNRSFYYQMQPYSSLDIKEYFHQQGKDSVYEQYPTICKNIGQIKTFLNSPYEDIIDYCNTIIEMISQVAQGNIFNITNKLNLKEDLTKWDLITFLNILEWKLNLRYSQSKDDKYFQAIFRINDLRKQLRITGVNKQVLMDNFLLGLKDLV